MTGNDPSPVPDVYLEPVTMSINFSTNLLYYTSRDYGRTSGELCPPPLLRSSRRKYVETTRFLSVLVLSNLSRRKEDDLRSRPSPTHLMVVRQLSGVRTRTTSVLSTLGQERGPSGPRLGVDLRRTCVLKTSVTTNQYDLKFYRSNRKDLTFLVPFHQEFST